MIGQGPVGLSDRVFLYLLLHAGGSNRHGQGHFRHVYKLLMLRLEKNLLFRCKFFGFGKRPKQPSLIK